MGLKGFCCCGSGRGGDGLMVGKVVIQKLQRLEYLGRYYYKMSIYPGIEYAK